MKWDRIEEPKPPKAIDDRWSWRAPDPVPGSEATSSIDQDRVAPSPDEDLRHSPLPLPAT